MNRISFIARLREALSGLPQSEIDEIVADYESHFAEASATGRSDEDVAAALGEPARLAKELKAEVGLKRLQEKPTPGNFLVAIGAFLGLLTLNVMFVLPILSVIFVMMLVWIIVAIALGVGGIVVFLTGLFDGFGREALAHDLAGIGLISGGIGSGALWVLVMGWLAKVFVSYARLHYQVLKPALDQ
jgi:uncharacterized membrane protein